MPHDDTLYVAHMLEAARKAAGKAAAVSEAQFLADENLQLALVHLIQVLGEAARRVSPATQARHPAIPWKGIIGMRHRVVHEYLEVDLGIVWKVVTDDLPPLVAVLEDIGAT